MKAKKTAKTSQAARRADAGQKKWNWIFYLLPGLGVALFVGLASLNLATAMWFDESYSAYLIRGDFGQIWEMTSVDVHPPLYYFCLKLWSLVFGTSEVALRTMSVTLGALAILLAFWLLKRWFGLRKAGVLTLFLSLSPLLIRYSQETRMYMLAFLIVVGATLVLDVALKERRKWAWGLYALLVALGMWTHYFTALVWLAELGYLIYYMRRHGRQEAVFWVYPLAVALFLPWVPSFLRQVASVQAGFWIAEVSLVTPLNFWAEGLSYTEASAATGWLAMGLLAVMGLTVGLLVRGWRKRKLAENEARVQAGTKVERTNSEREGLRELLTLVVVPPVLLMLVSLPPLSSTYMTRYVVYSAGLLMVVVGLAVVWGWEQAASKVARRGEWGRRGAAVMLAALTLVVAGVGIYKVDTRENTGEVYGVMTAMRPELAAGEPILFQTATATNYYDFCFYETAEHRVYGVELELPWSSLRPLTEYGENYLDAYEAEQLVTGVEGFWWVTDRGQEAPEYEGFEVDEQVETEYYDAFHYTQL